MSKIKSHLDFERALLTRMAVDAKDVVLAVRLGISRRNFHDEEHAALHDEIVQQVTKYGKPPGLSLVKGYFPGFNPLKINAATGALIDELVERQYYTDTTALLQELRDALSNRGKKKASAIYEDFRKKVIDLPADVSRRRNCTLNMADAVGGVWEHYEHVKASGGLDGIPWPWPTLNKATMGLHNQEYVVLSARPKGRKTAVMCVAAVSMAQLGYRVLFKTIEMAKEVITRRMAAIYSLIDYGRFRGGELTPAEEEKLIGRLGAIVEDGLFIEVVGKEPGDAELTTLRSHVDRVQPDVVFIDGAYLLADRDHLEQARLSNRMKQMAQEVNLPIVISTQLNRDSGEGKEAKLTGVAFSDAYVQDADFVIALRQTPEEKQMNLLRLDFPGQRESASDSMHIRCIHYTDFSEVDSETVIQTLQEEDGSEDEEAA